MALRRGDGGSRRPRIRDVAARAGVGVGTVSRVINESPGVAKATRQRVLAAIEELGYRPSSTARRLSLGRTQTLGVIAPFFTQSSVVERLRGIDEVIGGSGYDLTIFNVETLDQRRHALDRFARPDRLDGLIVISMPLQDAEIAVVDASELPMVLIDVQHPRLPHVAIDDVAGGAMVGDYLLAAGHRRIGFVGYPEQNPLGMVSTGRREEGLRVALARGGAPLEDSYVRLGGHGRDAARRLTEELLELSEPPTAIFAGSDMQALGVVAAVERAGLDVPADVSVIGFDDIELSAAVGLTTVRQHLRASGRRGAGLLLRALEPEDDLRLEALPELEVVERRTVRRLVR